MNISEEGKKFLKSFEGCRLKAYLDGGGVPTIGWGHTHGVKLGDTLTQAEADALFDVEIEVFQEAVSALIKAPVMQCELDAVVSLAYNIGVSAFKNSTLLKKLNIMDYYGASLEFGRWNQDNGKVIAGLARRREAERKLFMS